MNLEQTMLTVKQEIAIRVQNLKKSFGSLTAVDGITFTIYKQEIVGVLGPNGAGKTTTIRLVTGLFPLLPGSSVEIFGQDMARNPLLCKSFFGIVPEISNAFLDYTVLQNLNFTGHLYGLSTSEIKNRSKSLLEQFGLTEKAQALTKTLSKGLKQRLNFCMALLHDPPILVFDEPTSGLDPMSVRLLREQILHLRDAGKTILLTTHDMLEAQKICDRILIINKGKIIVDESPETLHSKFGSARTILLKPEIEIPDEIQLKFESQFFEGRPTKLSNNGYYQIPSQDPLVDIVKIHDFFQDNDIPVKDIKLEETSLEDIFIQLIEQERKPHE